MIVVQLKTYEQTRQVTASELEMMMSDPKHKAAVKAIHDLGDKYHASEDQSTPEAKDLKKAMTKKKAFLPSAIFQVSEFKVHEWIDSDKKNHGYGTWRHQEWGVLNGLFMIDYDDIDDPDEAYKKILRNCELNNWTLYLAFKTPSNHGTKAVLAAKIEYGNLASNQNKFSSECGLVCDQKCKDSSRLSYLPSMEDVYYFNPAIEDYFDEDYSKKYTPEYFKGINQADLFQAADEEAGKQPESKPEEKKADTGEDLSGEDIPEMEAYTYDGLSIRDIMNQWLGGNPPAIGKRHDTLLTLASELRHVCERNPKRVKYFLWRMPWVHDLQLEGDPVNQTIDDAMAYKYSAYMPKRMKESIEALLKEKQKMLDSVNKPSKKLSIEESMQLFGERLESMIDVFPTFKELFYKLPVAAYPACLYVGGALYGTLATRCWYYFYDKPEQMRRLNYGIYIVGDPAQGKGFASSLYKIILSPIIAADEVGTDLINDYKKRVNERETSQKDKTKGEPIKYPEVKIRIHGSRTANGVFIEDMQANSEIVDGMPMHLHLFTFDSELDNAVKNSGGGQWIDKSIFELKAFHNEEDNQQYRNRDSVTGPFDVFWNYVYTGTPIALRKKVNQRNFGSGLFSRLGVLPLATDKYQMMPFLKRSKENTTVIETLKDWAMKMDKTKGELPFWPLVQCAWNWCNDCMQEAKQANSDVLNLLIRRIPYYGINISAPFIIMRHWKEWTEKRTFKIDEKDKDLCRLVMELQLASQLHYFGKLAEVYFAELRDDMTYKESIRKSKNDILFENLPEKFDSQKLVDYGVDTIDHAYAIISRWRAKGWIDTKSKGKNKEYIKLIK